MPQMAPMSWTMMLTIYSVYMMLIMLSLSYNNFNFKESTVMENSAKNNNWKL